MDSEKIGKLIREARVKKGYTQKDLATKLGITDKAISKWECGKSFPDITMIESISNELEISVCQLVGVADNSKEESIMLEKIEKKIRLRMTIAIVIFSVIAIKLLMKIVCDFSTYWYYTRVMENIFYFASIIIAVTSLISSLILIKKRRNMYEKQNGNE